MLLITSITLVAFVRCKVHAHSVPVTKDESILLHSLTKRDTSEQLGPIPYIQRDNDAPMPILGASEGGVNDEATDNSQSSAGNPGQGSSSRYSPAYGSQNPSYDYTHSRTYQGSSQGSSSQYGTHVPYNEPVQSSGQSSQSSGSSSRTRTAGQVYRSQSGATATYSPSGSRTRQRTRQPSGSTGPSGRRSSTAGVYPLGPILSTGGGTPLQQPSGGPVYRGGHIYQPHLRTQQGQTVQRTYQTYPGQTQPQQPQRSRGGGYVVRQQQPYYTNNNNRQYTYTSGGQPVYTGFGPRPYYPQGGGGGAGGGGQQSAYSGTCPETGIRMRINGMECARAVDVYGSFLCYRHEYTSRECCEKCQPLKNSARVGCEYGDHAYQCRQVQAHDCYDLRNRQSCCQSCNRLRDGEPGCEWGDMIPRCDRVAQDPSLCYIPENQRLCCRTCTRLRQGVQNQECPWGDQNSNLCRPFDQHGGVRINCYAEPIRRMCCQTCTRLRSRMPGNMLGCEYGDRPVIFNTAEFGSLNCTSFFRHFTSEQCQVNQAVSINCCYTCYRYHGQGGRRTPTQAGRDQTGRG